MHDRSCVFCIAARSARSDKLGKSRRHTPRHSNKKTVLFAQKREASEMFSDSGIDASQEAKMPLLSPTRQMTFFSIDEHQHGMSVYETVM